MFRRVPRILLPAFSFVRVHIKTWNFKFIDKPSRVQELPENNIKKLLQEVKIEDVGKGIKKSVKNGFTSKSMFVIYNNLVKKYHNQLDVSNIIQIMQSYALCKERNFEIYVFLSNRLLQILKQEQKEEREDISFEHMYRYIIASSDLHYSDSEVITLLFERIKKHLEYFDLKKVSKLLHAQCKLKIHDTQFLEISEKYILSHFIEIKNSHIPHLIVAYSKSDGKHSDLCRKLTEYISNHIHTFDSISLYNILLNLKNVLQKIPSKEANVEKKPKLEDHSNNNEAVEHQMLFVKENEKEGMASNQNNSTLLPNLISLLFSKVNQCLPFLSLHQLIQLFRAYIDLNYFNYTYIYKRLLHFVLAKMESTKVKLRLEESILMLEFFSTLPYTDETVERITNLVIQQIIQNVQFSLPNIRQLFLCMKQLNINNDEILSRIDNYVFKNKKLFEQNCSENDLHLFLHFYEDSEEYQEMNRYLKDLQIKWVQNKERKEVRRALSNSEGTEFFLPKKKNEQCEDILSSEVQRDRKVIKYMYHKKEKKFNKDETNYNEILLNEEFKV